MLIRPDNILTMLLVCVSTIFLSCKPRQRNVSKTLAAGEALGTRGDDLPSVGRSAFDKMIFAAKGKLEVPYPFTELMKIVNATAGQSPLFQVMIPRGRSLQKFVSKPDYFKTPRIVLGIGERDYGLPRPEKFVSVMLDQQLYIAYAERANALEIISYNDAMGRFEFQVVTGYGGEKPDPKLYYAPRGVCLSCHQSGLPIFPGEGWNETTANQHVSELIRRARNNEKQYQGFWVDEDPARRPSDVLAHAGRRASELDQVIRGAESFAAHGPIWSDFCGGEPPGVWCRAAIFKKQFATEYGKEDAPAKQHYGEVAGKAIAARFPEGLQVRNTRFSAMHVMGGVLSDDEKEKEAKLKETVADVIDMARASFDEDPLKPRPLHRITQEPMLIRGADRRLVGLAFSQDYTKLALAINELANQTIAGKSKSLAQMGFRREVFLKELISLSGTKDDGILQSIDTLCCSDEDLKKYPPVALVPKMGTAGAPDLAAFRAYCGSCHTTTAPKFISALDEDMRKNVLALMPRIRARLSWEEPTQLNGKGPMPPELSEEYMQLAKPENASTRIIMQMFGGVEE